MKEFLIKTAILAVIVIAVVVLVKKFSGPSERPKSKTFQDVIEEDDRRLRADIEDEEPRQVSEDTKQIEQQAKEIQEQAKQIPIEDQVQAQRLFEMALAQRKMARLPGVTYKLMVDYCREIIQRYPNSPEAPKAQRMLREVPERYREIYNITDEEMGL